MVLRKFKHILAVCVMLLTFVVASAQSSADKLYNEGCAAMRTMTVASQNNAIAKFKKAKTLYDSNANKAKCDQQIQTCNANIKFINSGGGNSGRKGTKVEVTPVVKGESLEISNNHFDFDTDGKVVTVTVTTNAESWSAAPVATEKGESFVSVMNKEGDSFEIYCPSNPYTATREQKVEVSTPAGSKKIITIKQSARPVTLHTDKSLLEFKVKGGDKTLVIYSNYDRSYKGTNDKNWRIVSKPDWVTVTDDQPKKKGGILGKVTDKANAILTGDKNNVDDPSIKVSHLKVVVSPMKGNNSTRQGELLLEAGDKTVKVIILQK